MYELNVQLIRAEAVLASFKGDWNPPYCAAPLEILSLAHEGDFLEIATDDVRTHLHYIWAVMTAGPLIAPCCLILASGSGLIKEDQNEMPCLRPGTVVIGRRESGFYDDSAIILGAYKVGNTGDEGRDWICYAVRDFLGESVSFWMTLDEIGIVDSEPKEILKFQASHRPIDESSLREAETEIIEHFSRNPLAIDNIHPQAFESLVESIFKNANFATERVGAWNQADGGIDIIAIQKTIGGIDTKYVIQCKASRRKISARPLRELHGVLDKNMAHSGVVATTSKFTRDAIEESKSLWRLSLFDRDRILRRLIGMADPKILPFLDRLERRIDLN